MLENQTIFSNSAWGWIMFGNQTIFANNACGYIMLEIRLYL